VSIRVGAAQVKSVVGELHGNVERLRRAYDGAHAAGCDVVVFPELAITGYPPEDLLLRAAFVADAEAALGEFAAATGATVAVVGCPLRAGDHVFNGAALCHGGRVAGVYHKRLLPNYAVFDEERYFEPGAAPLVVEIAGVRVGVTICEDAWFGAGPVADAVGAGARVVVNLNASPYHTGRLAERELMLEQRAREVGVPIVYCNLVGGQDELVFDGASLAVDARGGVRGRAAQFAEDLLVVDVDAARGTVEGRVELPLPRVAEVHAALVCGTRDYVLHNGFSDVIIGLSGGIDSALVAAIAVEALGADHVRGVLMPSRYSSPGSVSDALALAANLGIETFTVAIEPAHAAFEAMLAPVFAGADANLAEENVQSRIRGNVMMTISNKFNWMVLTTGNKSEMATGYATLYGDMAGGFAVIKDVPKLLVWELCRDLNTRHGREIVPAAIISKPPSAELKPDQLDSDSLPDYAVLDPIIEGYVEDDLSVAELVAKGHDEATVRRVARMIDRNEYKRRQAPPGVRITAKAFGKDRRLPITNRYPG
jgi:NAD+ synthase (glutamine-hydrolysing)